MLRKRHGIIEVIVATHSAAHTRPISQSITQQKIRNTAAAAAQRKRLLSQCVNQRRVATGLKKQVSRRADHQLNADRHDRAVRASVDRCALLLFSFLFSYFSD